LKLGSVSPPNVKLNPKGQFNYYLLDVGSGLGWLNYILGAGEPGGELLELISGLFGVLVVECCLAAIQANCKCIFLLFWGL